MRTVVSVVRLVSMASSGSVHVVWSPSVISAQNVTTRESTVWSTNSLE